MLSDRVSFAHFCLCVYPAEWEHPEYTGGAGGPELQDRVPTVPASWATGVSPTADRERRGTSTASEHRGTPGQTGGHCHLTGRENVHTAHTEREYPCHGFIYHRVYLILGVMFSWGLFNIVGTGVHSLCDRDREFRFTNDPLCWTSLCTQRKIGENLGESFHCDISLVRF